MKYLNDTDMMPFGKHKGVPMEDVPASYLHYLWTNGMEDETETSPVAEYIQRNQTALEQEHPNGIW